jgi:hypothetical protein
MRPCAEPMDAQPTEPSSHQSQLRGRPARPHSERGAPFGALPGSYRVHPHFAEKIAERGPRFPHLWHGVRVVNLLRHRSSSSFPRDAPNRTAAIRSIGGRHTTAATVPERLTKQPIWPVPADAPQSKGRLAVFTSAAGFVTRQHCRIPKQLLPKIIELCKMLVISATSWRLVSSGMSPRWR